MQDGSPESVQYFDQLNRPLRSAIKGFNDNWLFTDTNYNSQGQVTFESLPYEQGGIAYGTHYFQFDALGRAAYKTVDTTAGIRRHNYSYNGLSVTIDVTGLPSMQRSFNSLNQLMETIDSNNGSTRYAYNSMSSPVVIQDAMGNNIYANYNGLGHKLWITDPNQGRSVFITNGFGEVVQETDANGDKITYTLDELGRTTKRAVTYAAPNSNKKNSNAYFVWDTMKKGLLTSQSENGAIHDYRYDSLSRSTLLTSVVDNKAFQVSKQYDVYFGRLKGLAYPKINGDKN